MARGREGLEAGGSDATRGRKGGVAIGRAVTGRAGNRERCRRGTAPFPLLVWGGNGRGRAAGKGGGAPDRGVGADSKIEAISRDIVTHCLHILFRPLLRDPRSRQTGRASCRARVCKYV